MNLENEFIPYEQALALKELGFDEPCFAIYGKSEGDLFKVHTDKFDTVNELHFIKAPTFSQAFRWFREKYGLHYQIEYMDDYLQYGYVITEISINTELEEKYNFTYEEAELECLKKLIEIVKNK